jgi:hypothetical protein
MSKCPGAICSIAFDIRASSPRYAKKRRRANGLSRLVGLHLEPDATTLPREARANMAVLPVHSQIALLNNSSEKRSLTTWEVTFADESGGPMRPLLCKQRPIASFSVYP